MTETIRAGEWILIGKGRTAHKLLKMKNGYTIKCRAAEGDFFVKKNGMKQAGDRTRCTNCLSRLQLSNTSILCHHCWTPHDPDVVLANDCECPNCGRKSWGDMRKLPPPRRK